MTIVWRVFAYLKRYPLLATGTLACAIIGTLMVVVFPAVTKLVIDEVLIQHRPERLDAARSGWRRWLFSCSTA